MKNAMVCPNEIAYDNYTGQVLGWRIAQVEPDGQTFPVGDPCYWMPCADDVVADFFYYDPNTSQILPKPPRPTTQVVSSGTQVV
jgi:hypothetical protein